jgi:GTP diphosphokinase / guanosine-3',5'-bis(diphosphate) 3'-diphosphatase
LLRFNDIADRALEVDPECDLELLQRAYVFSAKVHEGQERVSGEPYLVHPLEVAGVLLELRLDTITVAAGLLHDTVEDGVTSLEEVQRLFGDEVAFLVEGLTKISKVEYSSARERQAESFRKMLVAMSKDIRILLIKLADRLHNMRTIGCMPEDKGRRIAQETLDIYVPLAHRLGIDWMRRELEDHAFRTLNPTVVAELETKLKVGHIERDRYIEEVKGVLSAKLAEAGLAADITGRQKDLSSIHAKMEKQGVTLEKIYDVIAFRIILDGPKESVYHALGLVHAIWPPVPGRFKDYVALPKANGYQSLHTTVIGPYGERMEVQLRTREMHQNAELGIAAHWKYKGHGGHSKDDAKFAWLRQLIERQGELEDPHEFLEVVKVDLFPDEVFVFTPRGDVVNLPKGATALDFAYAIHSQVGEHCAGARVNGTMRPLSHKLADGDTVEIQTSPSQAPKKDWLDFAVSGKARSRIRHAIREAENARSRELGRGLLERELRRASLSLARLLESDGLAEPARRFARGSTDDLFAALGYGKVAARDVLKMLRPDWQEAEAAAAAAAEKVSRLRSIFKREKRSSASGITVDGHGDVMVRFGRCCTPLPGDEIVGFVTRGRGITVHARDCRVAFTMDAERQVEVEWDQAADVARKVRVKVTSRDEPGLLAKITKTISSAGVNIGAARIVTHADRTATQSFDLWVSDVRTLNEVMKEIGRIKGVHRVERMRS